MCYPIRIPFYKSLPLSVVVKFILLMRSSLPMRTTPCLHRYLAPFLHGSSVIGLAQSSLGWHLLSPMYPSYQTFPYVFPPGSPIYGAQVHFLSDVWTFVTLLQKLLKLVAHYPHLNLPFLPLVHLYTFFIYPYRYH
jgi:hypothetical protein